jgi:hypothetical protein
MSAHRATVDPQAAAAPEKLVRGEMRVQAAAPGGAAQRRRPRLDTPRPQAVLKRLQRGTLQTPVMALALSTRDQNIARQLANAGLIRRVMTDEGLGYYAARAGDDDDAPDPVMDRAGAVAYAGDLAALEADAARTEP